MSKKAKVSKIKNTYWGSDYQAVEVIRVFLDSFETLPSTGTAPKVVRVSVIRAVE